MSASSFLDFVNKCGNLAKLFQMSPQIIMSRHSAEKLQMSAAISWNFAEEIIKEVHQRVNQSIILGDSLDVNANVETGPVQEGHWPLAQDEEGRVHQLTEFGPDEHLHLRSVDRSIDRTV